MISLGVRGGGQFFSGAVVPEPYHDMEVNISNNTTNLILKWSMKVLE